MDIRIAQRYCPYSHLAGTRVAVPASSLSLEVFPARLHLYSLAGPKPVLLQEVSLGVKGPVKEFTVTLDLERNGVRVWGQAENGYFRYRVEAVPGLKCLTFFVEKCPEEGLNISAEGVSHRLEPQSEVHLEGGEHDRFGWHGALSPFERLSMGCHKAQDIEAIARRAEMSEILPFWYRLASRVPDFDTTYGGVATAIPALKECLKEEVTPQLFSLFTQGIEGLFSPRLEDCKHQGFPTFALNETDSAMALLVAMGPVIREIFFQEHTPRHLVVLPKLPPAWHCGRFVGLSCGTDSRLSLEWTKKTLRRMVLRCGDSGEWNLNLPHHLKTFRVRQGTKDRGRRLHSNQPLQLEAGFQYFFDNFLS